jgi:hypothetical protein
MKRCTLIPDHLGEMRVLGGLLLHLPVAVWGAQAVVIRGIHIAGHLLPEDYV